ncbi:SCO0607 family lipoprotein [Streptomyces albogriseolus]|uniref:SCO0607 family lipoprotein n=1 Tax=Streptomyces albogriseolus TaxID=1887 RepID=UPI0037A4EC5A
MRKTLRTSRAAHRSRRGPRRFTAVPALGVATALVLAGCGLEYQEDICDAGEYPATHVGSTGSVCVSDGEQPPRGYTRYPEGKVPQQVDDTWDVYWRTQAVDENGDIVDAPEGG